MQSSDIGKMQSRCSNVVMAWTFTRGQQLKPGGSFVFPSQRSLLSPPGKRQTQGPATDSPAAKRLKMDPSSQSPGPSGKSTPQPPSGKSTPSSRYSALTYLFMLKLMWNCQNTIAGRKIKMCFEPFRLVVCKRVKISLFMCFTVMCS